MSNLIENKQQMFHIASEIVVLFGITFYFNQKNKKLLSHIEDLSQRVEDQEDIIQKHEQVIRKLLEFVNQQSLPKTENLPPTQSAIQVKEQYFNETPIKRTKHRRSKSTVEIEKPSLVSNKQISNRISDNTTDKNKEDVNNFEVSSFSGNDSDNLDAEILDELEELKNSNNDLSLKKKE